jgi:hypothetical protein
MVGTRVGLSKEEVLGSLRFESVSHFEAAECDDPHLYERAVTYHEAMSSRRDIDQVTAQDHGRRARGLKTALRRLKSKAA